MSPENARAQAGDGRAAVRRRQLHARGPAGDQPAGQPDRGTTRLPGAARHAAVGVPAGGRIVSQQQLDYMPDDETQAVEPAWRRRRRGQQAKNRAGSARSALQPALHLRPRCHHGPSPVHDHADRARRLGPDLASRDGRSRRGRAAAAARLVRRHLDSPGRSSARTRGSRERAQLLHRGHRPGRARPGVSRSGCAAPAATSSACSPSSATPTPIRSAPTWRASSTRNATGAAAREPARPPAAPQCRPGTCWPAWTATWTSSPTTCGSTTVTSAPTPKSRR